MAFKEQTRNVTPQPNFAAIEFIGKYHVACVLMLDTSGSMDGNAIRNLNAGIRIFKEQFLKMSEDACGRIDIALITFGQRVEVLQGFRPASEMETPELSAGGNTPMGEALNIALDMITERKALYTKTGTPYYRPWIFCITDGEPNDDWQSAALRLQEMESGKHVLGYGVGVEGYNRSVMAQIFNPSQIFELEGLDFASLFEFVSGSLASLRESSDGKARLALPEPVRLYTMGTGD